MSRCSHKPWSAACFVLLALALSTAPAFAKWPEKPVRVVVPFAPGGGTDIVARMMAARLSEQFGQHFVVDNRGGAGGLIGTEIAAHADADGYTVIIVAASYPANAALYKLSYDPVKGIAPVGLIAAGPLIVVVNPSVKATTFKEFIALARAKPGALSFGSSGTGSSIHLAVEWFRQLTHTDMVHVPYKGTGPAMTDLLSGQIQFYFGSAPTVIPLIKAGRLRALAVTTTKRSAAMPDLPSISEEVPGFEYTSWYGMWTAARTPQNIVNELNQALARALSSTEVQQRLRADGVEPAHSTPEEFASRLTREIATWKKVVQVGNIKAQ